MYSQMSPPLYEYQRFQEDYFTGCDVRLFFGDILIDEIVNLNFVLMENVKPIFGYASRTADAFARGSRIIQGNFTINFKGPSYLKTVIDQLSQIDITKLNKPFAKYADEWHKPRSIDEILEQAGVDYQGVAEKLQRAIWGEDVESDIETSSRDTYFYKQRHSDLLRNGFNILITYGNVNKENSISTSNSIIGVQLSGVSKEIRGNDGTPILEMYQFMAKDLDGDISQLHR